MFGGPFGSGGLAVFSGGATLEAASAVCCPGEDRALVVERLESLIRKNLLHADFHPDAVSPSFEKDTLEPRVTMLETMRAYAFRQLEQWKETQAAVEAHAHYFLNLAQTAQPYLFGKEQLIWLLRLDREINNLRAANTFAQKNKKWAVSIALVWALWRYWWVRGLHREARQWMETVLADSSAAQLSPLERCQAALIIGSMAWAAGDNEQALLHCQEAVSLCSDHPDRRVEAVAKMMLGCAYISGGVYEGTGRIFGESIALFSQVGETWGAAFATSYAGVSLLANRQYDEAIERFQDGLHLARLSGNPISIHQILYNLGIAWMAAGKFSKAAQAFTEGLNVTAEAHDSGHPGFFIRGIAEIEARSHIGPDIVQLLGAAENLQESVGAPRFRYELEREGHDQVVAQAKAVLGAEAFEQHFQEGRRLPPDQARQRALALASKITGHQAEN